MSETLAEFERLRRSGDEHYSRREYSIAAACYEAALKKKSGDSDLLFNYAYALAETGNHAQAAEIYGKAIEAGSGSAAHNNRGNCFHRLGQLEKARDEFRAAAKLNDSRALYWRNLASCLTDLKDSTSALRALENLVLCNDCTASDWNTLGMARERSGDTEGALAAFTAAAAEDPDCAYFYNIGLMHERLGHVLDAFHACRHALQLNASYESALKVLPRLQTAVEKLHKIPLAPQELVPRDVGPHDYINPYTLLNVPAPDGLMWEDEYWFTKPEQWEELFGSFARRRKTLRAELELNEGHISWLPELVITEETVHRILGQLDDTGWHPHHWAVFTLPLLNRFLMHGNTEYFHSIEHAPYPLVALITRENPDQDDDHLEFTEFVSPFFSQRSKAALKVALDAGVHERICEIFGTTAPVTGADMDEVVEPLRRYSTRRRGELDELASELEKNPNTKWNAQLESASGEAQMLNLLPRIGEKLREDLCRGYRSLSIALANSLDDYEMAERALRAAERFKVSESLKQRLADDRKAVENLLKQQQEEKQREQELTLRLTLKSWFRERTLEITPEHFRWHEESLAAEEINRISYGITIRYTNGFKSGVDSVLSVAGTNGKIISTTWLGEHDFSRAVQSLLGLHGQRILSQLVARINGGATCQVGQLQLDRRGIGFESGIFFTKQLLIPWRDVIIDVASGNVQITSRMDLKVRASVSCRESWNACLLPTLVRIIKNSTT